MAEINEEMANLYIEAVGIVLKLRNFIRINEIPNSKLYLEAADDFIKRNNFYKTAVNGFIPLADSDSKQIDDLW